MLRESDKIRQVEDEPHRRWFWDDFFDLVLWDASSDNGAGSGGDQEKIVGFQLKYQTPDGARVLTWRRGQRCVHHQIDEGDDGYTQFDMTELLVRDGQFSHATVRDEFRRRAGELDAATRELILEHMHEFARTQ